MRSEVKEGEDSLSVASLSILVILYFSCSTTQSLHPLFVHPPSSDSASTHLTSLKPSSRCVVYNVQVYRWLDQLDVVSCVFSG